MRYHEIIHECAASCARTTSWEAAKFEIELIFDREGIYARGERLNILEAVRQHVWSRRQQELNQVYLGFQFI